MRIRRLRGICFLCLAVTATVLAGSAKGSQPSTYVYVASYGDDSGGGLFAYSLEPTTGILTPAQHLSLPGQHPNAIAAAPGGTFVYATVFNPSVPNSGLLMGFAADPLTGALSALSGSPFATDLPGPVDVKMDPTGSFIYVANQGDGIAA